MTGQRTTRDGNGGAMPPRLARTGARRSGIAGAILAAILVAGATLLGTTPGAIADIAPTALPTVPVATVASGAPSTLAPTVAPAPAATQSTIQTATSTGTPAVATVPMGTDSVTPSASPAIPSPTGTPTVTISAVASPAAKAAIVNAGVTARARLMASAYAPAPSVDLYIVGAPSLALGPGQVIAVDLQAWAGASQVVGIDAFLDFDPTRVEVDAIDLAGSPFDVVLQRTWVNEAGHVNLSLGRLVGASGAGASGYFRVARVLFRAAPGFTATSSATTAPVTFATDRAANRETAVLTRTDSVLRQANGATIALNPGAIAVTSTLVGDASIIAGIPASVGFTILDAANRPAAGVAYAVEVRGDLALVGPATGTTSANGAAIAQVKGATPGATGLVAVKVGGALAQARIVQVTTAATVAVTIASPSFALARGTVPIAASTTFGPVPVGSRFEVEWRYRLGPGGTSIPVEPAATVPVVGGIASATWDTTALSLAPAGVTRSEVTLEAEARAVDGTGNIVGLATGTFGPMVIDNQSPALAAVAAAGQPMADDPSVRTRIATRTFAVAGVTEDASTVAVYRRDTIAGPRPADAVPMATAVAGQVGAFRAAMSARAILVPATASFMVELPAFAEADENEPGFYIEVEAIDPAGNVGPVTLSTVNGRPVAAPNPYQGWLTLDTVAPWVAQVATPTFNVGDANAGSRPVAITFSEPVALRPADLGTKIRLEQEILDIREPIAGTLQVDCAPDVRPTGTVAVPPAADGSCASGVKAARIIPAKPWYPGGTYHVTVASGDGTTVDGQVPPAVADLAGNKLVTAGPGGVATTHVAFIAPGAPAFPTAQISGILASASFAYVIHGTEATPVPLRVTAAHVDTDVTWRLCADPGCTGNSAASPTFIAVAPPADQVNWISDTVADQRDAYLVVTGRNRQISGDLGRTTDVRRVTLRKVAPVIAVADVSVVPCQAGAATRAASSGTFVIADDCNPASAGLQVRFSGTVADAVPGTVTVSQVLAAGSTIVAIARHENGDATTPTPWTTVEGTVADGPLPAHAVSLAVEARDDAIPVANITRITFGAQVDTVAPRVTLAYPVDASRLAAASGTIDVPIIGVTSEGASTIAVAVTRNGAPFQIGGQDVATVVAGSDGAFRLPATGGTPLTPGLYVAGVRATDPLGNPGAAATATFRVTPPPPAAVLDRPGTPAHPGLIGPATDEDTSAEGVQLSLTGHLATTSAEEVPEGLVAILRRNGVDATGEGGRAVVAPVVLKSGTYGFAFPPLTFSRSATASFSVVTRDGSGNRSLAESAAVPVTVDVTRPVASIIAPRAGSAVGSRTPELSATISAAADGSYDVASATFAVRPTGANDYQVVRNVLTTDAGLRASGGTVGIVAGDWASPLPEPTGTPAKQAYDLRVTLADAAGNVTTILGTFVLQPGVPSVTLSRAGSGVLGTLDISQEAPPEFTVDATATGGGVTIANLTATLRSRATGAITAIPITGAAGARALAVPNAALPNGSVHDLEVVATDSNGATATTGVTIRVVRPRSVKVTVTQGATPVAGARASVRRDVGDLPAVTDASGPNDQVTGPDGSVTFTGIPGGDVVVAIDGVAGYPTTTIVATVTEPRATADAPWEFTLDLDALNKNSIAAKLRGLPASVTGNASANLALDVTPGSGARYSAGTTPAGVRQSFGDEVARVARSLATPVVTVTDGAVTMQVRAPLGAIAWKVVPKLVGSAITAATIKGATSAEAIFTGSITGETVDTSFRYVATNLRVKSLTGSVRLPDGRGVAEARVVVSQAGGLSISATTNLDGAFGPLTLEAGEYVVAPQATAGAAWLPGRAGRITFAATNLDGTPTSESGVVDLTVLPAGGTVQARIERTVGTVTELTTGTVTLRGEGRTISATAGSAVLPGQDLATGANVSLAAPGGKYVLTVTPDDTTLAAPDEVSVRVVSGQTTLITPTDLPALRRTLGRLSGTVRLTTGEVVAGMTVQARREGDAIVTPATTDDRGVFSLAVPAGRYEVAAVVPRGAAVLAGGAVIGTVASNVTTSLTDIVLTPASAVIERTLVKPGTGAATVPLTEDEASSIAGTAFVKDQATGRGSSVAFSGNRIRISVAPGTYRLSISVAAGGFLAPEAETGVVAAAGTPNIASRTVTPSNVAVAGRLVSGTTATVAGSPVALRAVVRATGIGGPAAGVVKLTESDATGAFTFALAQGTWRLAASPDPSNGYLANVERPFVDVTVTATGTVAPASPTIDLSPANKVISGSAVVRIGTVDVPLAGVRVRADVSGPDGSFVSIDAESGSDGSFSFAAPAGSVVVAASGASARYGVAAGDAAADDAAYVIDPKPLVIASGGATTGLRLAFENAAVKVEGTVTSGSRAIAGATVTATSSTGLVRTTTSLGGSRAGAFVLRLAAGNWSIAAAADLTTEAGARVPAESAAVSKAVAGTDIAGVAIDLVPDAVPLPPVATGSGDPETGAQVRAGLDSAELRLAPGAVSEAVSVQVVPLGNVPALPGFVPYGDAFQVNLTSTATGLPITNLSVDSTILVTYPLATLRTYGAPSTATHGQAAAQPGDLQATRFDQISGTYTPISTATQSELTSSTGQFAISTSVLGTFVLTTREALALLPVVPPVVPPVGPGGGGGGGGGEPAPTGTTTRPVISVVVVPTAPPALPVAPVLPRPTSAVLGPAGLSTDRLSSAIAAIPGGLSPTAAMAIGEALGAVDIRTARAFIDAMAGLPAAQAAHVLGVIASGTPEEARAAVAAISSLPQGATIARPGGSLRATGGAETLTYSLDDDAGPAQAHLVSDVEVAGTRHVTAARGTVVFLVRGGQAALVTRPRSGAWPDLRFPLLSGFLAGTGPSVALPTDATSLSFEPAPDGLTVVERGSLGGGIVVPLARPFAIRVEATDASARVGFALPSPKVGAGQVLAYLHSLRAGGGRFQGYLRVPAAFDSATGSQTWTLDARAASDVLVLVGAIQPGHVQNFDAAAHIYSGPDDLAVDFGEAGPAFTTFTVVGPQVGTRIYVYSPVSKGYGWIDAAGVGPSGPPQPEEASSAETAMTEPLAPALVESAPVPPARGRPDYVQNFSAGARLFSSAYDDAADFGPVGAAFVTFVVVGGPENGHLHVLDSRTGGYAWIEARDVGPSGPP
ncbi:MAG: hypothetical protein KGS10_12475 [Chloroflexi bacterium]|nr:hypothetical protein [Chloroflexota bacterium]